MESLEDDWKQDSRSVNMQDPHLTLSQSSVLIVSVSLGGGMVCQRAIGNSVVSTHGSIFI